MPDKENGQLALGLRKEVRLRRIIRFDKYGTYELNVRLEVRQTFIKRNFFRLTDVTSNALNQRARRSACGPLCMDEVVRLALILSHFIAVNKMK